MARLIAACLEAAYGTTDSTPFGLATDWTDSKSQKLYQSSRLPHRGSSRIIRHTCGSGHALHAAEELYADLPLGHGPPVQPNTTTAAQHIAHSPRLQPWIADIKRS